MLSSIILISGKAESGKDTLASVLKILFEEDNQKVLILHFADLLKFICSQYFNWNGTKDEFGREILQTKGTEFRKYDENFWVKFIYDFIQAQFPNEWDRYIIPDFRYPNEYEYLQNNGMKCITIRISKISDTENRLTEIQKSHDSETLLDNFKFDYYVTFREGHIVKENKYIKTLYDKIKAC